VRMAPAYERFELDRTGSGWRQTGQWLVVQLQFVAIESAGELVFVAHAVVWPCSGEEGRCASIDRPTGELKSARQRRRRAQGFVGEHR
jgi:hypothetical protein